MSTVPANITKEQVWTLLAKEKKWKSMLMLSWKGGASNHADFFLIGISQYKTIRFHSALLACKCLSPTEYLHFWLFPTRCNYSFLFLHFQTFFPLYSKRKSQCFKISEYIFFQWTEFWITLGSHSTILCLSFLICKMGRLILPFFVKCSGTSG